MRQRGEVYVVEIRPVDNAIDMRTTGLILMACLHACQAEAQEQKADFWSAWFQRVDRSQAVQPRWVTPLATTTARLEEEWRSDVFWVQRPGDTLTNIGGGKGPSVIPIERVEIIVSPPPYLHHSDPATSNGFSDLGMLVKYRMASANERRGNYVVTAFLGITVPTGDVPNGVGHATFSPSLAYGKGWGRLDVQGTVGVNVPTRITTTFGRAIIANNTVQLHAGRWLWPEVEVNSTHFIDGVNAGRTQVFITPALLVGRFHMWRRMALTAGVGLQVAATEFHTSNHNVIVSIRLPF